MNQTRALPKKGDVVEVAQVAQGRFRVEKVDQGLSGRLSCSGPSVDTESGRYHGFDAEYLTVVDHRREVN